MNSRLSLRRLIPSFSSRRALDPGMLALLALVVACGPSETYTVLAGEDGEFPTAVTSGSWRQFGGPDGDFRAPAGKLAQSWGDEGPPLLWSRELGAGYSAIAADGGVLFTMYRDGDTEKAIALRADDGKRVWESGVEAPTYDGQLTQFGKGPNAMPLVLDDRIVTLGYTGILRTLDRKTGEALWSHDLVNDFSAEVPGFGFSASPILHDGKVVVLVGGETQGAMAFDPVDGSIVWRSTPSSVSYSTPTVIDVDGQMQIAYYAADAVVGIDPADGRRLWSHPVVNQYENNCTNLLWGEDNLLWAATQLDGGTRMLRLRQADGKTTVEEVWKSGNISIHFWNALRLGGHVYATIGGQANIFAAVDAATGEIVWRERGFNQAMMLQAGDDTLFVDADGDLVLARLSPEGLDVKARTKLPSDETWTVPTLVGTTLYIRDQEWIRALDLGA